MRLPFISTPLLAAAILAGFLVQAPRIWAETPSASGSVLPTGGGAALFDPSNAVILLLDHQIGLFQTVKDIDVDDLRRNVVMLTRLATLLDIPVIATA